MDHAPPERTNIKPLGGTEAEFGYDAAGFPPLFRRTRMTDGAVTTYFRHDGGFSTSDTLRASILLAPHHKPRYTSSRRTSRSQHLVTQDLVPGPKTTGHWYAVPRSPKELTAINPHEKPVVDTWKPEELMDMDIIETKGQEVAEAPAALRANALRGTKA